jgi:hypothetical protein
MMGERSSFALYYVCVRRCVDGAHLRGGGILSIPVFLSSPVLSAAGILE